MRRAACCPVSPLKRPDPALIEKTRATVTQWFWHVLIVALRPGIYTVKFELPGFAIVIREGIELTSDFTATINADLKVGTLEETLTVTGESPSSTPRASPSASS